MALILVANPGSASRKYALYSTIDHKEHAVLHVEMENGKLHGSLKQGTDVKTVTVPADSFDTVAEHVEPIFREHHVVAEDEVIAAIGLRIVAPSSYFGQDHVINDEVIAKINEILPFDPIHVSGTLDELEAFRRQNPKTPIVLVSDSAFHAKKPSYAWNYGINLHDADTYDIKRFGYHGISVAAAVNELWNRGKLPPRVVVCHLGSGSSVSAVFHGRSIDNTMGYSALEGVIMATRSGTIDYTAAMALQKKLGYSEEQMEHYLDEKGGLLGLSGSNDIRELLQRETDGDHIAHLALATMIHSFHKSVGAMIVAMNGADLLVFTGTVGERSAIIRKRIVAHLECMDFILDGDLNNACTAPDDFTSISQSAISKPIIVIPTDESHEIARRCVKTLGIV